LAEEPRVAAARGPAREEDFRAAHDDAVRDHLLERRVGLGVAPLDEEPARPDLRDERIASLRVEDVEAVRPGPLEELRAPDDVDEFHAAKIARARYQLTRGVARPPRGAAAPLPRGPGGRGDLARDVGRRGARAGRGGRAPRVRVARRVPRAPPAPACGGP